MNQSWTNKNLARSIQFGGICPVYSGGIIHRKLDEEQEKSGFLSGGKLVDWSAIEFGGSWRNTKGLAISWTNHLGSVNFFYKGNQFSLNSVPSNHGISAASLNKSFLIVAFSILDSNHYPISTVVRKYQSFLNPLGDWPADFSDTLQAEISLSQPVRGFTEDGRSLGDANGGSGNGTSGGFGVGAFMYRFSPDFTTYTPYYWGDIGYPSDPLAGGSYRTSLVDGLGFSVYAQVMTPSSYGRVFHIQPVWGADADPYTDDPVGWTTSVAFDNLIPEDNDFVTLGSVNYFKNFVYSSINGVTVYTYGGGPLTDETGVLNWYNTPSSTHQMILILDGATHVLSDISGLNMRYFEDFFVRGLAIPGTDLLYLRWGYPTVHSRSIRELHIDLKTRQFIFHDGTARTGVPLGLTSV